MGSETAPEPQPRSSGGGKIRQTLTAPIGPLPMWAWVAIAAVILVAWRLYANKGQQQSQAATSDTGTSANDVPQFVNQTYTTVTPPQQGPPGPPGPPGPAGAEEPPGPTGPATRIIPRPEVRPGLRPPKMVTGIKGTGATANSISAAWANVAGATSYLIRVTYQGKLVKQVTSHSPFSTITGLGPDHTYTVHVAAVGPGGTSSESNGPAIRTAG